MEDCLLGVVDEVDGEDVSVEEPFFDFDPLKRVPNDGMFGLRVNELRSARSSKI